MSAAGPLRFLVTIHRHVEAELDKRLGFDVSSTIISRLLRELPTLPAEMRQDRDEDEPDAFHHSRIIEAFGTLRTLDFTINDGWEPDHLHVIGLDEQIGRRALVASQLGPLE